MRNLRNVFYRGFEHDKKNKRTPKECFLGFIMCEFIEFNRKDIALLYTVDFEI